MEQLPAGHPRTTPRDFFLHLFATAALYFSAVNVIALLWQYVDHFLPDPIGGYTYGLSQTIRFSMSFLVVVFPAYVVAMWYLGRDVDRDPEKANVWVRRWAIHLTLFVSGVTILGDLIYLVYSLTGGDFTGRFLLKAFSVLVVAAAVFAYYIFLLRRAPGSRLQLRRVLAIVSLVLVAALIIGAFCIIGSPISNRKHAWDAQRVSDLQSIQYAVVEYWQQKERLPESFADLKDPISSFMLPTDPQTKADYEYRKTGDRAFELCATFALPTPSDESSMPQTYYYRGDAENENWRHAAGRQCFTRTIDPERYPPYSKIERLQ